MDHSSLMTKLTQSWNSEESIFEQFENKPLKAAVIGTNRGKIPLYRMLADIYFTVKDGEKQDALMMLDILACWIQSSETKEAEEKMREYITMLELVDIDKDIEEFFENV